MTPLRTYALRLKEDCERWDSPVPRWLRCWLHAFGKHLYCATYGMSPQRVEAAMGGGDADAVEIIHANRIMQAYGTTLGADGTSYHIHCAEDALLAMLAFYEMKENWYRMLYVNGIDMQRCWNEEEMAERFNYPKGTKFYYEEPTEPLED